MNRQRFLNLSLIIQLIPIFLISFGSIDNTTWLWWTGLIMLGVGGLMPPIAHFAFSKKENDNQSKNQKEKS